MSIAVGIAFIVLGAILTFALKGGHIGDLDLHAVGVILMLAGVIGILLPKPRSPPPRSWPEPTRQHDGDVLAESLHVVAHHEFLLISPAQRC